MRLAGAPISWGVWGADSDVDPDLVLDDTAALGYTGTEMGPPGYIGTAAEVRSALASRELALVGSFLDLPLSRPDTTEASLARLDDAIELLWEAAPPGSKPLLILSDAYDVPERVAASGQIEERPDAWLDDAGWETLLSTVNRVARLSQERGVAATFHPHSGSYVETPREIARLADGLESDVVGLCLDSGHVSIGGGDPLELLREYRTLVNHVHLKDVDHGVLRSLRTGETGIEEAWDRGVFCAFGDGAVDLDGFLATLREIDYDGWVVIEQDQRLGERVTLPMARDAARRNRAYLADRGL
jgi:inosose dehydratase